MNDLLQEYPKNRFLLFLAGRWMVFQQNYDLAARKLEGAVATDPYPAALNELAYAYAFSGNFPKAFSTLDRYVSSVPDQANAQDSYGEISRLCGRYQRALEHSR